MIIKPLRFRRKIVLLALALVVTVQSVTLFFVLTVIQRDSESSTRRTAALAGAVFDEYIDNRSGQLQTAASVLATDFGFREAVATSEPETIRSMLENHMARIEADLGLLIDSDGNVVASTINDTNGNSQITEVTESVTMLSEGSGAIVSISNRAFQVVGSTIRAPLPVARVIVGFEIKEQLVQHIRSITGLDVTFVGQSGDALDTFASTLLPDQIGQALLDAAFQDPDQGQPAQELVSSERYLSVVRSFVGEQNVVYAVLQLPLAEAEEAYREIQEILLAITIASLLAALIGSLFVGRMVTRPVDRLTAAVRRMSEGVYDERVDMKTRDEFGELAAGFNTMQAAIADRQSQIVHAAAHNSLTGLPNRDRISANLRAALEQKKDVAVASLSIRRFNKLIATLGYETSDELIRQIAIVLRASLDSEHELGYDGGNEFLIVFSTMQTTEIERALSVLGRELHDNVRVDGTSYALQCHAGVASTSTQESSEAALLHAAAIARMAAESRHEAIALYERGQEERLLHQTRLLGEFADGISDDQFAMYLQPKVRCATREVYGAEALVRWHHPELGLLPPGEFVEVIEQAGSISLLTRWMLTRAIRECRAWRDQGLSLDISVNISADDLLDEYLPYFLLDETHANSIEPASVTLEVTESAIMHDLTKALSVIQVVHELGFRLSIDDFGTGQSSLAQLRRLPVDELKIDRSFIVDMEDARDVSIVLATIEMANGLGLDVCAEGIEKLELLSALDGMGAQYAQGFAISEPIPDAQFLDWYRAWEQSRAEERSEKDCAIEETMSRRTRLMRTL